MTITIPSGLAQAMIRRRQSYVLAVEAPDVAGARAALARFRELLWPCPSEDEHDPRWHREGECPGPKLVSEVIPLPTGGAILVDAGDTPDGFMRTLPDVLHAVLDGAGLETVAARLVTEATLIEELHYARRMALLFAIPFQDDPGGKRNVPPGWADVGFRWLGEGPKRGAISAIDVGEVEDASVCEAARTGISDVRLVSGDPATSFRLFYTSQKHKPFVAFGVGGAGLDDEALVRAAEELVEVGRRVAPEAGLAFLSFEPDLIRLDSYYRPPHPPLDPTGGVGGTAVYATLFDHHLLLSPEIVVDAFPYHVLTQAHIERLGSAAGDAVAIAGVEPPRFELRLGSFAEWLPERPTRDPAILAGRRLLAPMMMGDVEALQEVRARRRAADAGGA